MSQDETKQKVKFIEDWSDGEAEHLEGEEAEIPSEIASDLIVKGIASPVEGQSTSAEGAASDDVKENKPPQDGATSDSSDESAEGDE